MSLAFLSGFLIILLGFLLILSGVEYSYLASNKLTIELKKKQGTTSGRILGRFFDRPETFWNGTVTSFYVILVLFCYFFILLSTQLMGYLPEHYRAFFETHYFILAIGNIILISWLVLITVGLLSKRSFEQYPEGKLNTWSLFVNLINRLSRSFVRTQVNLSEVLLKYLFNVQIDNKRSVFARVNPEQFARQTLQGHEDLGEANKELFDKALQLTQTKVRKCMVPRNEMLALDITQPITELKKMFVETRLNRIVIYRSNLDNVLGYTRHVDLYQEPKTIQDILHSIPTVPETMNAIDLIQIFTKEKKSLAWIIDEFGGTAGFVSMEGVLEEIFGDFNDEYDPDQFTEKQISLNDYIFSGRLTLDYINEKYQLNFPLKGADTLSGYIIAHYESIPKQKEKIIIGHYEFDILRVSETRIETVKIHKLPN